MQWWGKTKAGKTRYRCSKCGCTSTWKRKDIHKHWFSVFLKHILQLTSLKQLNYQPQHVVCDGQKGLIKAIHILWPEIKIQRCLIHLIRGVISKISHRPKTTAGKELYQLTLDLANVWTRRQKKKVVKAFLPLAKKIS